jgi:hypothetical protein
MNATPKRSRLHITQTALDALDVIVSYCDDPDRVVIADLADELGTTHSWARRVVSVLRHHGYVMPYTVRARPDALDRHLTPTQKRIVKLLEEARVEERRVTHIDVARWLGCGEGPASVRLSELRQTGALEPRWALWPTAKGVALAER